MEIRNIKYRLSNLKLAVIGYKTGHEPGWLRLKRLASVQAMVEESDERALEAITDEVRRNPKAAREARQRMAPYISRYGADRAVRLIDAAMHGSSMQPIRPECVEMFGQEAKLGRMPLRKAFAEIASREPELERMVQQFEECRMATTESSDHLASIHTVRMMLREVDRIIGPRSQHPDPLLRSDVPRNIVFCWLRNISGTPPRTDPDASYFSRFNTANFEGQ